MYKQFPQVDQREGVAVSHAKGTKHRFYEDAFRMLSRDIPMVAQHNRGEIYAVFDGIGSAPEGRHSAQVMADALVRFFREPDRYSASESGLIRLLDEANREIHGWGMISGADRPLGGCAGTVLWILEDTLRLFHAGDTAAVLIRDGHTKTLTREHTAEDGALFKYFGIGNGLTLEVEQMPVEEGDRILLVTDGVTKYRSAVEASALVADTQVIQNAVRDLVHQCQLAGVTDDITAMLVDVEELWSII